MLSAGRRADTPPLRCAAEVPRLGEECHAHRPGDLVEVRSARLEACSWSHFGGSATIAPARPFPRGWAGRRVCYLVRFPPPPLESCAYGAEGSIHGGTMQSGSRCHG